MCLFTDIRFSRAASLLITSFMPLAFWGPAKARALDFNHNYVVSTKPADAERAKRNSHGYLFVNGKYVDSPYSVTFEDEKIVVNGLVIDPARFDLSMKETAEEFSRSDEFRNGGGRRAGFGRRQGFGWRNIALRGDASTREADSRMNPMRGPRGFRGEGRRPRPEMEFFLEVSQVTVGSVVVLFDGESPLQLYRSEGGADLIRALVRRADVDGRESGSIRTAAFARAQGEWERAAGDDAAIGHRLIAEFEPSIEFLSKAEIELARTDAAQTQGEQVSSMSVWLDRLGYPLTVLAMAIVVLGFGHLLQHRPHLEPAMSEGGSTDWSGVKKVVVRSLTIVALLSVIDLIWTSVSAHAGVMREMNPIGSGLIDDPAALALFKVLVTALSIGILYVLHRRPAAQVASWWCCLVLTLLTARWLVFQSMFL